VLFAAFGLLPSRGAGRISKLFALREIARRRGLRLDRPAESVAFHMTSVAAA